MGPDGDRLTSSVGSLFLYEVRQCGYEDARLTDQYNLVQTFRVSFPIRHLVLSRTQVSDEGLLHLKKLTSLSGLYISGTQITDAGLVHLKELNKLEELDLSDTQVTDDGLIHLKELTNLAVLTLSGTQVTDDGVEKLQQALPDCEIFR